MVKASTKNKQNEKTESIKCRLEFADSYPKSLAREVQSGVDTTLSGACKRTAAGERMILAANASWHRVFDEAAQGETVSEADFEFLAVDVKGVPEHFSVSFSRQGGWDSSSKNLESELGLMDEEAKAAAKSTFISEKEALTAFEGLIKEYSRKAPHMRLIHVGFTLCDDEFEIPTWRIKVSNWPIITYLKSREKNIAVEAVIDAVSGKMLRSQAGAG